LYGKGEERRGRETKESKKIAKRQKSKRKYKGNRSGG
jgi:hypothetical protein